MRANGVQAFLGVSTSYHNFLDLDPVLVVTGFKPMGESAVLITSGGETHIFVTPHWDASRAQARAVDANVQGAQDIAEPLSRLLQTLQYGRIGVAGLNNISDRQSRRIRSMLGDGMVEADAMLRVAGNIPTAARIAAAKKAVQIAEEGYEHLLKFARPGLRECDISAEVYALARSRGADDNFILINGSQHGRGITVAGRRIIEKGDVLVIEITPSVEGQFIQLPRTAVVGEPSPQLVEDFELLRQASLAGLALAKPGAKACEVAQGMNRVIAQAGYADYCRPPYMRVRGHGMGNIANLPGDITLDNESRFEEDMVLVIHAEQYLPRVGYLLVGEPVRIGRDGAIPLMARPIALDVIRGS